MTRKEIVQELRNLLDSLQIRKKLMSKLDKEMSKISSSTLYISSYERERVIEHLDAAQASVWTLIGQLCQHSADCLDSDYIEAIED